MTSHRMKQTTARELSTVSSSMSARTSSPEDVEKKLPVGAPPFRCKTCPKECTRPLTVFARHNIIPGREKDFEQWVKEMASLQHGLPGYLSSELIRPTGNSQEYVSIFRYDNYAHLEEWMNTSKRAEMVERANAFSTKPIQLSYHSLEYWFVSEPSQKAQLPPPRWKMMIVTFLTIWAQLQFVPDLVGLWKELPFKVAEALTTLIIVILTTYLWFPILTRVLAFWLFPDQDYLEQLYALWAFDKKSAPVDKHAAAMGRGEEGGTKADHEDFNEEDEEQRSGEDNV